MDTLGLLISSLAPTASLLCALEKVGYEPDLESPSEERRSISGRTTVSFLDLEGRSDMDERARRFASDKSSLLLSRLVDRFLYDFLGVLVRSFSGDRALSEPFSFFRRKGSSSFPPSLMIHVKVCDNR